MTPPAREYRQSKTLVSIPPNPSAITNNGTDVDLKFGTRVTFDGVTLGTITCDATVLSRDAAGNPVCPETVRTVPVAEEHTARPLTGTTRTARSSLRTPVACTANVFASVTGEVAAYHRTRCVESWLRFASRLLPLLPRQVVQCSLLSLGHRWHRLLAGLREMAGNLGHTRYFRQSSPRSGALARGRSP